LLQKSNKGKSWMGCSANGRRRRRRRKEEEEEEEEEVMN
jgi:hypothetical protein